ncbi:MAG: polysaccharide biosynthesis protein [Jejuia sp.]
MLEHPKFGNAFNLGKLIGVTGVSQILVQAIGFISGILVIRLLPVEEYALYTLANTMLGTMTVLADGGISSGLMAEGGKVWQDKEKLGVALATGLDLRKKFAVFSLIVLVPVLFYLLIRNNASWLMASLIVVSIIPAFFSALSDSLLQIVPKLHQKIVPLQKNQLEVGLLRLVLLGITIFIFPFTYIVLLVNGVTRIYGNIKLQKIAKPLVGEKMTPDLVVRKNMIGVVKKIMPGAIYYSISGQISVWLLSIFGSTTSVAEIGALARFSLLLTVFASVFATIAIPRFSRLQKNNMQTLKIYMQLQAGVVALCLFLCLMVFAFSHYLLLILGDNYFQLENELLLVFIAGSLSLISGLSFSLGSSKGYPTNPYILIITNICFLIMGYLLFDISTLIGVLYFNIFVAVAPVLIHSSYFYYKMLKDK